jgi:hypothetical protein
MARRKATDEDRKVKYCIRLSSSTDKLVLACMDKYKISKTQAVEKMILQGGIDILME